MDGRWSLETLYKSFEDEKLTEDVEKAKALLEQFEEEKAEAFGAEPEKALEEMIKKEEQLYFLLEGPYLYASLTRSVDMENQKAQGLCRTMEELLGRCQAAVAKKSRLLASIPDLDSLILKSAYLSQYSFLLKERAKKARHLLEGQGEEIFASMNLSGGALWANMRNFLVSSLMVPFEDKTLPLAEIRNMAQREEEGVRKKAYEAELAACASVKEPVAFALNGIKQQVNAEAKLRGYSSPLEMTLDRTYMKKETLDSMLLAIEEALPAFHRYLKRKGKLLEGKESLSWWNLFAPLGESSRRFTVKEAEDYLVSHFVKFAPDMADMIKKAFGEQWIDFFPRKGKAGGASCCSLQIKDEFRIQTNFSGSLKDVVTLAHELGHGYHGLMLGKNSLLNRSCSMPLAETASTFNETVIMEAAIREAEGAEKIYLLESRLQDITQIICDIYSRFLFEKEVFEKGKEEFLSAGRLCGLMREAQKKAYGDGLEEKTLHPYMWICKGHYYSSGLSYYNYPYAFGGLFAIGLYNRYCREGEAFVEKYRSLLTATSVHSMEEIGAMAGIDITKPDFWRESLSAVIGQIEQFLELTKG